MNSSYIKSIFLPKSGNKGIFNAAYPIDVNVGTINIICGPNNCGKTYLLRRLRARLDDYETIGNDTSLDIRVKMTSEVNSPVNHLYFGKSWQDKDRVGAISIGKTADLPKDRPPYRHGALSFLYNQLSLHFPNEQFTLEDWFDNKDLRIRIIDSLELENTLYSCSKNSKIVNQIETLLGGKLYFRRASKNLIEIVIVTPQELSIPYHEWSEGQKAAFYLMLMLDYSKPSILLIDEIENHLHPYYMTAIMNFIKKSSQQTFIATHHPHVIFTNLADRVFYLENHSTPKFLDEKYPDTLPYTKVGRQRTPKRNVTTLSSGFNKISATYKLFDMQDHQLLKQCSNIATTVEITFYKTLIDIFTTDVVSVSNRILPDRQTQLLADIIKKSIGNNSQEQNVTILDIGTGLGRVASELAKLSNWQIRSNIKWICWEPNEKVRDQLKMILEEKKIDLELVNTYTELPESKCQISLLDNVLHEVCPDELVSLIYSAWKAIKNVENGKVIILEIYPLLKAEKYAVAYPQQSLVKFLNSSGFVCSSDHFSINDSLGYCIVAKPINDIISPESLKDNILKIWSELEVEICSSYACQEGIDSYIGYRRMIQELTTLASMAAWRNGLWPL